MILRIAIVIDARYSRLGNGRSLAKSRSMENENTAAERTLLASFLPRFEEPKNYWKDEISRTLHLRGMLSSRRITVNFAEGFVDSFDRYLKNNRPNVVAGVIRAIQDQPRLSVPVWDKMADAIDASGATRSHCTVCVGEGRDMVQLLFRLD